MKIALYGATGWVGSTIAKEALSRGHEVTAIVRDPARLNIKHQHLKAITGNAADGNNVVASVKGHDVVVVSVSGRRDANQKIFTDTANTVLSALPKAGVKRLLWVGGAGSLEVAPGKRLVDTPQFPPEYKDEALAQGEALKVFQTSKADVDWSFLSPAAILQPGQRTGKYRSGGDQLLQNEKGESTISVDDFAVALVDELERPRHHRRRFTVAY